MAVNEFLYWSDGVPYQGIDTTNSPTEMLYWDAGLPYQFIPTTTTVVTTTILKVASTTYSSAVNKVVGILKASINKIESVH